MTQPSPPSPLAEEFVASIHKLDTLWNLVPRSARPLHKSLRDDLARAFEKSIVIARMNGAVESEVDDGSEAGESPLAIIMRMMRSISPEEFLTVKILMMMRDLSDRARFEMFEEIGGSHHLACGGEVFPDEVHECEPDDDGDDDGADGLEADDGGAIEDGDDDKDEVTA